MPVRRPARSAMLTIALAAAASACVSFGALAAPEVPRLVKLIVPYPPGGSTDQIARRVSTDLGAALGTTFVIENRAGAGSVTGTNAVAKSKPDGGTLLITTTAFTITAGIQPRLPYDPETDLVPLGLLYDTPLVVAIPANLPYRRIEDLIADARARPGVLNYGTSGIGSTNHLATELLSAAAGIKMTHVPYKGMSQATVDLLSGRVQLIIASSSSLSAALQSDKVRAIAMTGRTQSRHLPGLPAVSATLPGYSIAVWFGMFAPRDTPRDLVALFDAQIRAMVATDAFAAFVASEKGEPGRLDAAGFATMVRNEIRDFKRIAAERRIEAE